MCSGIPLPTFFSLTHMWQGLLSYGFPVSTLSAAADSRRLLPCLVCQLLSFPSNLRKSESSVLSLHAGQLGPRVPGSPGSAWCGRHVVSRSNLGPKAGKACTAPLWTFFPDPHNSFNTHFWQLVRVPVSLVMRLPSQPPTPASSKGKTAVQC